jgi:hypothetical protein
MALPPSALLCPKDHQQKSTIPRGENEGAQGRVHGAFPRAAERDPSPRAAPPEEKKRFSEGRDLKIAMKKTTSQREKTHFSLGDAFFLL